MKVMLLAAGSALCALICLAYGIAAPVLLLVDWRAGLLALGASLVLGAVAKRLDRQKMRAIYGRQLGDLLHEDDAEGLSALDLAEREQAACAAGGRAEPVGSPPRVAELLSV